VLRASVVAALLLSLTGIPGALAGTTGKLSGRVLDKKNQPLAGVNMAVPAARLGAVTDADGRYVIIGIPAGTYEVKVNLLGYGPVAVQDVRISADNTTPLDVTLAEAPVLMKEVSREMEGMMGIAVPVMKGGLWCINRVKRVKRAILGEKSHA